MPSSFDDLTPFDAEYIRKRLLAGDRMADVREDMPGITAYKMSKLRDELFAPPISDPEAVKALANGHILNPLKLVSYSHSRRAVSRSAERQFDAFQGDAA